MRDARGCQLGKEDVLRAFDQCAADHGRTAERGLPERDIEHMVQAERDERALDEAIQPGARIARGEHERAQRVNAGLDHRPDEVHRNADQQIDRRGDDRHKARAAEKAEHLRQLDFVKAVVQCGHAQADDDAAEHAHLQRVNAEHARGRAGQVGRAKVVDHCADGRVHDKECDDRGEGGDLLLLLCHADRHADCKDQRQVVEHNRARIVEHLQDRIDDRAWAHDAHQAVGLEHGFVGERAADAEKQAGDRQNGDRQHKRTADALQYAENLIFHLVSSSFSVTPMVWASRCRWMVRKVISSGGRPMPNACLRSSRMRSAQR